MKTYEITAPDGKTYEVTGEGTADQALAHIQSMHGAKPAGPDTKQQAREYSLSGKGGEGSAIERGLGGAKHTLDKYAMGLKSVFTDLTPEDRQLLERGRAFDKEGGVASTVGGIAGDIALTAPLAAATGGAAAGLPLAARTALPLAVGAATGAAGAMPGERGTGAALGAAGAGAGQILQRALGGAVKPIVSQEAKALMQRGIQPTVGQAVDQKHILGRAIRGAEEATAKSLPIVGDIMQHGRQRAVKEFSDEAIKVAGAGVPGAKGAKSLEAVRDAIGNLYDDALKGTKVGGGDDMLKHAITVTEDPDLFLSGEQKARVLDFVQKKITGRIEEAGGTIDGALAKNIDSDIGKLAAQKMGDPSSESRAIGQALRELQAGWRENMANFIGGPKADQLRAANSGYTNLLRGERAAAYAGGEPGVITPNKLSRAVGAMGRKTPSGRAPGTGPMAQLAQEGQAVLPSTTPDSGTAKRLLMSGGAIGAVLNPAAAVAGAAQAIPAAVGTAAAYSRVGQRILTQGVAPKTAERFVQWAASKGIPEEMLMSQLPNAMRAFVEETGGQ